MRSWRSRQCCGSSPPPPIVPFSVAVSAFTILHNDAFPDGTYAEISFDHPIVTAPGTSLSCDITLDTSDGPEAPDGSAVSVVGPGSVNLTTAGQVATLTIDGTCVITDITGISFGPGGTLILPASVNQTNGI